MRKKALTIEEREIQVINWFAIRIQHDNDDYATSYEIAGGLGMSPSTHFSKILNGMVEKGTLDCKPMPKQGRFPSRRGYMLVEGTFQRPPKQTRTIKFTYRGISQMELF